MSTLRASTRLLLAANNRQSVLRQHGFAPTDEFARVAFHSYKWPAERQRLAHHLKAIRSRIGREAAERIIERETNRLAGKVQTEVVVAVELGTRHGRKCAARVA